MSAGSRMGTATPVTSWWMLPASSAYPCRRTSASAALNSEAVLIVLSVNTSSGPLIIRSCWINGAKASKSNPDDEACSGSRPATAGVIDHRPRDSEALHEEHLIAFHDPQLNMLSNNGVKILHYRHRRFPQAKCRRRPGYRFPHLDSNAHFPVIISLEPAETSQLLHKAGGRGDMQPRTAGNLRDTQCRVTRPESVHNADYSGEYGLSPLGTGHGSSFCDQLHHVE